MKNFFIPFFFLLITNISLSQKKVDSLITNVIENKETSYYKLRDHFKNIKLTETSIHTLLKKSKKNNYVLGEVYAKSISGHIHKRRGDYNKAIKEYEEALHKAELINNKEAQIVLLNQLGIVNRYEDNIRESLTFHQKALDIILRLKINNKRLKISKSISINSIGNIFLALKQYERARNLFNQSIVLQYEVNDKIGLAINYQNIGYANENLGEYDIALINYKKSLDFNLINNDEFGKVICHNSIANVLIKKGNYQEAYKYINEVVKPVESLGKVNYRSKVYNTLGLVLLRLNRDSEANVYLQKSLQLSIDNNNPENLILTYNYLSQLYVKALDYKKSLHYYKKSIEIEKNTFAKKNILYLNSLITKYDNEITSNKLKNLAKENEITNLKYLRYRNILIIALVSITLFGVLLYSVYRQRLLKNEKQILLLEQEALRIQMNPHFVFNALNSIKLYIINNEQKNAVHYLYKFSKLIRSILESTTIKEVSLAEEMKTMDLYMSIENIRFSDAIKYSTDVDPNVSIDTIKIPSLVLQPFLENSIWHGLSSRKGEKKINLSVSKISDKFILIEIEDTGVGRKEAFRIKSNKTLKRKSIGIGLTEQRLHNFSTQFENDYSLIYKDLINEDGSIKGTRVSLKLPII